MFGSVIYFDNEKIDEYESIITGKKSVQVDEYHVSDDKGLNVDLKVLGADAKVSKSYTAKVKESILYDCLEFEKLLSGRDDYFDFSSDDYDLTTVPRGSIIKIDALVSVPENFDMVKMIEQFKPFFMGTLTSEGSDDENGVGMLKNIFGSANAKKIPILVDYDEFLLCSKIQEDNLFVSYEELQEYESTEVSILARCSSTNFIKSTKPFYDPLKDFLSLNRMMRKHIADTGDEFSAICADKDYKTIEILAIYQ